MTKFTKDELLALFKCIRLAEIDHRECSELDNLKFKIQSLIDNYSENNCNLHNFSLKINFANQSFYQCSKCGRLSLTEFNKEILSEMEFSLLQDLVKHKQYQIDENRAVQKSLEELRKKHVSLSKGYQNQHSVLNELRKDLNEICHRLDKLENPKKTM